MNLTDLYPDLPDNHLGHYLGLARMSAIASRCSHRKVGAVLVNSRQRVIAASHNRLPRPANDGECNEGACPRGQLKPGEYVENEGNYLDCIYVHAEQDCIQIAGTFAAGCYLYVTHQPCGLCLRAAASAGIYEITFWDSVTRAPQTLQGALGPSEPWLWNG